MQSAVSDIIAHNLDIVQKHMKGKPRIPPASWRCIRMTLFWRRPFAACA